MSTFNERSWLFIDYLLHEFFEFMVVHELALVHELNEFMTVYEQPMFMNKVRVHARNKFTIWWTFMKVSWNLLLQNIHEPFMNTLMNVHERS